MAGTEMATAGTQPVPQFPSHRATSPLPQFARDVRPLSLSQKRNASFDPTAARERVQQLSR